jgi:hypothetical protein
MKANGKLRLFHTYRTLADIDPNLTIFYFSSYDSQVARNFNQDRLIARFTSLFGLLALALALLGCTA